MFKKTYGILYEQNAYVFTDFFKELENYYTKGTVSTFFPLSLFSLPWNLIISTLKWRKYDLFHSLLKIPSIRLDSDQFMLERRLRCSVSPSLSLSRRKGALLNGTVLPILPENLELW